ncbi:MAG: methyl-accepting chemotaxis protein [Lachnospiraceae bacterium]|nr:methyl-accepting chemotaxis protein [Lachnospiraceae bacterium]
MKSLRGKMTLIVVLIVLLCSGILSIISYFKASTILSGELETNYSIAADRYAQELTAWMNKNATIIDTLCADINTNRIFDRSSEEFHTYLETNYNILNSEGFIYDIYFTDPNSIMVCASDFISDGSVDYAHDREWFLQAAETKELYYSSPYMDSDSGLPVVTISKAIFSDGELKGVLCADIFVDTLVKIISEAEVAENSYAFLLDQNLGMVVHPNEAYTFDDEPYNIMDVADAPYEAVVAGIQNKSEDMVYLKDYDGITRGIVVSQMPDTGWFVGIATSKAVVTGSVNQLIGGFLIAALISVVVGVIVSVIFAPILMKDIDRLGKVVAQGDISRDLEVNSKDEIGTLSSNFNLMMHKLRAVVSSVTQVSDGMNATAVELKGYMSEIGDHANRTAEAMNQVTVKMQDQVNTVDHGRRSLGEFIEKTAVFGGKFNEMREAVDRIEARIDANVESVDRMKANTDVSNEKMSALYLMVKDIHENSDQIMSIVNTIVGIADQTNLLALNASIEAARAGEAGRGFAVVADEIRSLSEQTNNSIGNISAITEELYKGLQDIAGEIESVNGLVSDNRAGAEETKELFTNLSDGLRGIYTDVSSLSEEFHNVLVSEKEIESALSEIDSNARVCNDLITVATDSLGEQNERIFAVSEHARSLGSMADELHEKAGSFAI